MSEKILFVLEGEKTEKRILDKIEKTFFGDKDKKTIFYEAFKTDIYKLWKEVKEDNFLDLLELLKERGNLKNSELEDLKRDDISQIYLFFDYDGHATKASDDKIEEMLEYFNEETENGKLYISYPMVEALRDLNNKTCFKDNIVKAKENIRYKAKVGKTTIYPDLRKINRKDLELIISENLCKANFIVNDNYTKPAELIFQDLIFSKQLEKFIKPHGNVAVLSAFPFFLIEYFGKDFYNSL